MRKFILLLVCVAAFVSVSSACGDDEDAAEPVSMEELTQKYSNIYCAREFSCCTAEELPLLFPGDDVRTEEECHTVVSAQFARIYGNVHQGVEAGRSTYHADKAGACLRAFANTSCGGQALLSSVVSPVCNQIYEGKVEEGGACSSFHDCRHGGCVGVRYDNEDDRVTQMGTCTARGDVGDECGFKLGCKAGNYCANLFDPETQAGNRTCQKIAEIGQACSLFGCVEGAYCDVDGSEESPSNTCKLLKSSGKACDSSQECESHNCAAPAVDPDGGAICQNTAPPRICDGV